MRNPITMGALMPIVIWALINDTRRPLGTIEFIGWDVDEFGAMSVIEDFVIHVGRVLDEPPERKAL